MESFGSICLLCMVLVPLVGSFLTLIVPGEDRIVARRVALLASVMAMGCGVGVLVGFDDFRAAEVQLDEHSNWSWSQGYLPQIDMRFHLGVDGISLWLILLSALLSITAVSVSWRSITHAVRPYYSLILLLEAGMVGVFAAQDVILFYVFFEFTLIPLFFLIGVWGNPDQRELAARKFFIYTFAGSVFTFLSLIYIVISYASSVSGPISFSIPEITAAVRTGTLVFPVHVQWWLFLALLAGFAIKVPLFPFHTWLPLAHVEAPTAGSVLLAGVLLKIGTYGILRFALPLFPDATAHFMSVVAFLAVVGILYGAFAALAQDDIKRLVAYSSVSHMGFCVLGLFAMNEIGVTAGLLQSVNHGLSTGALFALVGMLYERYHTRKIRSFSGLAKKMPVFTFFFLVITFSSIGLPGLNGFVGEILVLLGIVSVSKIYAFGAAAGIILGAYYMLWLVQRIFFGELKEPETSHKVHDLDLREILTLVPIATLCLWIGLFPESVMKSMKPAVSAVITPYQETIAAGNAVSPLLVGATESSQRFAHEANSDSGDKHNRTESERRNNDAE